MPPEEFGSLLSPKQEKDCEEGDWVVIGKGIYRGDIGQVERISRNAEFLTVRNRTAYRKVEKETSKKTAEGEKNSTTRVSAEV